jgi:hypothetical protein
MPVHIISGAIPKIKYLNNHPKISAKEIHLSTNDPPA